MHKPGILIKTVYKPDDIIHATLNVIVLIQYIYLIYAYKYGLDANENYFIYISLQVVA